MYRIYLTNWIAIPLKIFSNIAPSMIAVSAEPTKGIQERSRTKNVGKKRSLVRLLLGLPCLPFPLGASHKRKAQIAYINAIICA